MSGIFPGSPDLESFWKHLEAGDDLIGEVPGERWDWKEYYGDASREAGKTNSKWGGFIEEIDKFDAEFFGISEREAELMDPQHRLMLELAWRAIENGGEAAGTLSGKRVGVFIGVQGREFLERLTGRAELAGYAVTGNSHAMAANRISFLLNLRGPSEAIDTACSSSLIALNRAVQALRSGECDAALVGGVSLMLNPEAFVSLSQLGVLSPEGRCKTFDAGANGYVRGEGAGVLYLKRLTDAEREGHTVWGVIRAVAVNHGGRAASLTAPSKRAQSELVREAYERAGWDPLTVGYIEVHGTGTELGDPVEVDALKAAFSELRSEEESGRAGWCGIGSVKANIGHLEPAAGMAGLIKVLLAMKRRVIPPSIHVKQLNRYIDLAGSPFYIATEARRWESGVEGEGGGKLPLRAGVSSFGFGGSNAHVAVEEYAGRAGAAPSALMVRPFYLVTLSAKGSEALRCRVRELREWIERDGGATALEDISYTLNAGREHFGQRLAVVVETVEELKERLEEVEEGNEEEDLAGRDAAGPSGRGRPRYGEMVRPEVYKEKLEALGELYVSGYDVDWTEYYEGYSASRVRLPEYPFQKRRYWVERSSSKGEAPGQCDDSGANEKELIYFKTEWEEKAITGDPGRAITRMILWDQSGTAAEKLRARLGDCLQEANGLALPKKGWAGDGEKNLRPSHVMAVISGGVGLAEIWEFFASAIWGEMEHGKKGGMRIGRVNGPLRLLMVSVGDRRRCDPAHAAVLGMFRSLSLEDPNIAGRLIITNEAASDRYVERLVRECTVEDGDGAEICWDEGTRWVRRVRRIEAPAKDGPVLKERGVYLITGGAGGIGRKVAEYLAKEVKARLVLCGRSAAGSAIEMLVGKLRAAGGDGLYVQADVGAKGGAERVVAEGLKAFGRIDGVIHAAGVMQSGRIRDASREDLERVWRAKMAGAIAIDAATRELPLEWMVLFSSVASLVGIAGAAGYASGNAFLDEFARWREEERRRGNRRGRTVSINWPSWRGSGMELVSAAATERWLGWVESMQGFAVLEAEGGVRGLLAALRTSESQLVIAAGDGEKMERTLRRGMGLEGRDAPGTRRRGRPRYGAEDMERGAAEIRRELMTLVSKLTGRGASEVEGGSEFTGLGLDSIALMELSKQLNRRYGIDTTPVVFFQYPNVGALADYIAGEMAVEVECEDAVEEPSRRDASGRGELMAVIGMSGTFPQARNVDEFWENLKSGVDCIREVPKERWDTRELSGAAQWGGMIEGVDQFDAEFFGITPLEAEMMDPQQRLFLQTVWEALEDSGHAIEVGKAKRIGLFAGIGASEYGMQLYGRAEEEEHAATGVAPAMLVNRVSYLLNLTGPSEAVDTACSSSLVALHRAVRSLAERECEAAIVGGVNLILTPKMTLAADRAGMLSKEGRCKAFDEMANGYVRSEGVAAMVLKRFADAQRDGDTIYGLILGTAVNHGGRANSLTAPNPNAQAEVIARAWRQARVPVGTIGYMEAHGTGTALGDPVEAQGLKLAFEELAKASGAAGRCGVGSVKSNIGHLESAAGMAGVIKVLLAFRHKMIPGSLHVKRLNPYLKLEGSPFWIVTKTVDWEAPRDGAGKEAPRRAGVSSFGFGGTNAHVAMEEAPAREEVPGRGRRPLYLVTLSGRTRLALRQRQEDLMRWLESGEGRAEEIVDISYTLNAGRDHFGYRCVLASCSAEGCVEILKRVLNGERAAGYLENEIECAGRGPAPVFEGLMRRLVEELEGKAGDGAGYKEPLMALGDLYVKGYDLDWGALYKGDSPRRISAPKYPFEKKRFWMAMEEGEGTRSSKRAAGGNGNGNGNGDRHGETNGLELEDEESLRVLGDLKAGRVDIDSAMRALEFDER